MEASLSFLLLTALLAGAPEPEGRQVVLLPDSALLAETASCPDDDAYEPDDTPASARTIASGEVQPHRHCDPDWLRLKAAAGSTWAIETRKLQSGADTVLELYERPSPFGSYQRTARDDDSGEAGGSRIVARLVGADPYVGVFEARSAYGPGKGYEVTATCLSRCQDGQGHVLVLPALFQGEGSGRPFLSSDLLLANPGFASVGAELLLSSGPGGERLARSVRVAGGATLELRSVLATTFGLAAAEAALEVRPDGGELLASAVLRDRDGRPLSVFRAEPIESSLGPGRTGHLLHLDGRRPATVSVGLVETTGGHTAATLRILDAEGAVRAERTVALSPYGVTRLDVSDLARDGGVRATIEPAGGGRLLAFALVVEAEPANVFLSTLRTAGGGSLHVPGALAAPDGTVDVRVTNLASQARGGLSFLSGRTRYPVAAAAPPIPPGATLALDDALAGLAALGDGLLTPSSPDLVVSARLRGRDGGSAVEPSPPLDEADAAALGTGRGRVSIPLPGGTRSLVLLAEHAQGSGLGLTASLVGPDGRTRAAREVAFPAGCPDIAAPCAFASEDLLAALGAPEAGARLDVEVPATPLRLSARASVEGSPDLVLRPVPLGEDLEAFTFALPGPDPLVLRRVPPGTFWMGSPEDEAGRDGDELLHRVTITQPFLVEEDELDERKYNPLFGGGSSYLRPVTDSSWEDITGRGGVLDRLNGLARSSAGTEDLVFRLPTEAEWEWAARGGTTTPFPVPLLPSCDLYTCAPCAATGAPWACGGSNGYNVPHDARYAPYLPAGPYGLREMLGNVWEWVADRYGPYAPADDVDPQGPTEGDLRVIRGGSFLTPLRLCRSANRFGYPASGRYGDVGFRVVLAPAR